MLKILVLVASLLLILCTPVRAGDEELRYYFEVCRGEKDCRWYFHPSGALDMDAQLCYLMSRSWASHWLKVNGWSTEGWRLEHTYCARIEPAIG